MVSALTQSAMLRWRSPVWEVVSGAGDVGVAAASEHRVGVGDCETASSPMAAASFALFGGQEYDGEVVVGGCSCERACEAGENFFAICNACWHVSSAPGSLVRERVSHWV